MNKVYVAIDLKSFYASCECVELGLDPLNTNLVVADKSRTEKTICLAVSTSLKSCGISGRANADLNRLLDSLDEQPQISVTYFVPDEKKSGGKYVEKVGVVRIYDSYASELVFTDGVRIAVADMAKLDFMEK